MGSAVWVLCGCGYHHYDGPLKPLAEQGVDLTVAADGGVTFTKDHLEIRLRYVSDQELDRQFAARSQAGPQSTNPFTCGDTECWSSASVVGSSYSTWR